MVREWQFSRRTDYFEDFLIIIIMGGMDNGRNGHSFYVGGDLMMRRGMLPIIMLPDGNLRIVLHLVPFWILTIWESVHIEETVVGWRNQLCYITPGTSLVNEAPPMPLRASSHPGSPNSPSCSALAWYSCWPGLSPWGKSWKRTRVARTAALTCYRYATQPTNHLMFKLVIQ